MIHQLQPISYRTSFLRRRFRPHYRLAAGFLDAVPLINVVLLFFLFFMANSPFVLQPGIIVNLPASPFNSGVPYGSMVVTISQEGMIFFQDDRVTMEGLAEALAREAKERPDSTLLLEADGRVFNDTLVQVYNVAVAVGIEKVVLATRVTSSGGGGL
jgi:biopolymer transport protein ExbD